MLRLRLGPAAALEIAERGAGARRPHRGDRALRARRRRRARAGGLHLRRAATSAARCEPAVESLAASRRSPSRPSRRAPTPTSGRRSGSRAALRGRARARRDGRSPRAPSTTSPSSRACSPRPSAAAAERRGSEAARCLSAAGASSARSKALAAGTSRRGFLARVARAMAALTAGGLVSKAVEPGEADAYHFCGHIFTTGSCPHPLGGLPADRPDGLPAARLGRQADRQPRAAGQRARRAGRRRRQRPARPDGRPLPPAPRTKVCQDDTRREVRHQHPGRRRLVPLLRRPGAQARRLLLELDKRINGDAALEGYCYSGRKVFCVMYFQTNVPC